MEANTIGSEMGASTRVEVGMDPGNKERFNELQKKLAQVNKELEQTRTILLNYSKKMSAGEQLGTEKMQYVQQLATVLKMKQAEHARVAAGV